MEGNVGKITSLIAIIGLALILMGCGDSFIEHPMGQDKIVINKDSSNKEVEVEKEVEEEVEKEAEKGAEVEESRKDEYIQKLDDIEFGLSDLDDLYAGTTVDMKYASAEEHKRWDNVLNEIYSLLEVELSSSKMDELREKEIAWIEYRDITAKNESLKFEGGTMEGLEYTQALGNLTKERCYELVRTYMK